MDPVIQESFEEIQTALGNAQTQEQILKIMENMSQTVNKVMNSQNTPPDFKTKLKSRKFWVAVLAAVAGVYGMLNSNGNTMAILIFVGLEAVALIGYFFTEGTIDSTRTKEMIQAAISIAQIIGSINPILLGSSTTENENLVALTSVEPETPVASEPIGYDEIGDGIDADDVDIGDLNDPADSLEEK